VRAAAAYISLNRGHQPVRPRRSNWVTHRRERRPGNRIENPAAFGKVNLEMVDERGSGATERIQLST